MSANNGGYVRVVNIRKDMMPDAQPESDESVVVAEKVNQAVTRMRMAIGV